MSYFVTSSHSNVADSASLAATSILSVTASYALNANDSASWDQITGIPDGLVSGSYIESSSYSETASYAISSSYSETASFALNVPVTASYASDVDRSLLMESASYAELALTASYYSSSEGVIKSGSLDLDVIIVGKGGNEIGIPAPALPYPNLGLPFLSFGNRTIANIQDVNLVYGSIIGVGGQGFTFNSLDITMGRSLLPVYDNYITIGTSVKRFKNVHAIEINSSFVTASAGLNLTSIPNTTTSNVLYYDSASGVVSYDAGVELPPGIVSSSTQVDYELIQNVPEGIVSGSSQISYEGITDVPSGIISGSSQVTMSEALHSVTASYADDVDRTLVMDTSISSSYSAYAVTASNVDTHFYIVTGGSYYLPTPSTLQLHYFIKNTGSLDMEVSSSVGVFIDEETTQTIPPMSTMRVMSFDSTNWYIM